MGAKLFPLAFLLLAMAFNAVPRTHATTTTWYFENSPAITTTTVTCSGAPCTVTGTGVPEKAAAAPAAEEEKVPEKAATAAVAEEEDVEDIGTIEVYGTDEESKDKNKGGGGGGGGVFISSRAGSGPSTIETNIVSNSETTVSTTGNSEHVILKFESPNFNVDSTCYFQVGEGWWCED